MTPAAILRGVSESPSIARPVLASHWRRTIVLLLLVVQALLVVGVARRTGCTTDEPQYLNAARIILRHGWAHERTILQGPLALYANQLFVGEFPAGGFVSAAEGAGELLARARLGTLLFVLPGTWLVYAWSRRLFGDLGGLLSLLFLVLHPLWLAHAGTALVDAQHACMLLLALYALARHLERPGYGRLALFAAAGAAAVATKYLALVPLVPAGLLALGASVRAAEEKRVRSAAAALGLLVLVGWLVLHACYGFRAGLSGFGESSYSVLFARARAQPGVREVLAVLPTPFVQGLDYQARQGERTWASFLEGEFHEGDPRYYLFVFLWRTPELLLLLLLPALLLARRATARSDLWALGLPLATLFLYLSCATTLQVGVRYLLVLVPALCLVLGALGTWTPLARAPARAAGFALLAGLILVADLRRNGPDWLAYFNTLSGGPALAYRHLRDTNGDFGQQQREHAALLAAQVPQGFTELHPWAGGRFGRVAVRLAWLLQRDPGAEHARLDWVLAGEPIAHLGAAWLVFEVTPESLAARLAAEERVDLRRALGVAHLAAGNLDEAERVLAPLGLRAEDPLQRLLGTPELPQAEREALWAALGREDLAGETVRSLQSLRPPADEDDPPELRPAAELVSGQKIPPGPRERQLLREAYRKLLE